MFEIVVAGFALMVGYAIYATMRSPGFSIHPNEDEKQAYPYYLKGQEYYDRGDYEAAAEAYADGLLIAPGYKPLLIARAHVLYELKAYDAVIATCAAILERENNDYQARLWRGYSYREIGKLGEALSDFNFLINRQPFDITAHVARLDIYMRLKQYDNALQDAQHIKKLKPDDWTGYFYAGTIYYHIQRYREALTEFADAKNKGKLDLEYEVGRLQMSAWSHYMCQQFEQGMAAAQRLVEIVPDQWVGHYCYGCGLHLQGMYEEALPHLERGHALNPELADTSFYLGHTLFNLRRFGDAIKHFDTYIHLEPDNVNGYLHRAQVYTQTQQHTKAIADYTRALELQDSNAMIYNNRSWSKAPAGDYQGALDDANRAIALDPDQIYFYSTRGQASWLLGNHEAARTDFQHACHFAPDELGHTAELAVALNTLGRADEAIELWKQITLREDDLTTARKLQDRFNWAGPFYNALQDLETLARQE